MRAKLTASFIERLKCPDLKTQFKVFDSEVSGLAVRVTKNGIKTFIFERRPKGGSQDKKKLVDVAKLALIRLEALLDVKLSNLMTQIM